MIAGDFLTTTSALATKAMQWCHTQRPWSTNHNHNRYLNGPILNVPKSAFHHFGESASVCLCAYFWINSLKKMWWYLYLWRWKWQRWQRNFPLDKLSRKETARNSPHFCIFNEVERQGKNQTKVRVSHRNVHNVTASASKLFPSIKFAFENVRIPTRMYEYHHNKNYVHTHTHMGEKKLGTRKTQKPLNKPMSAVRLLTWSILIKLETITITMV